MSKYRDLKNVYSYKNTYITDPQELIRSIKNKSVVPYQVEVQPGPKSKKLCWLECPYCYGGSSKMTGEHLDDERYTEILQQVADGGVKKVIFAGYATDPLNYKHIANLTRIPLRNEQIIGFHTKAIKVSNDLLDQLSDANLSGGSYFSVSVDAGSIETYNIVHGLKPHQTKFYDSVVKNITKINERRSKNNLDLSVTYLLNEHNCNLSEVSKFIEDFKVAGVDIIRFTFPQIPRGYSYNVTDEKNIPGRESKDRILGELKSYIESQNSNDCQVIILDYDKDIEIEGVLRTLPCFARWVFPSIGYDGYLAHCSESAAPHFRSFALGNLNDHDFWDLFYDYDPKTLDKLIKQSSSKMNKQGCRCDRKEHTVNKLMSEGNLKTIV